MRPATDSSVVLSLHELRKLESDRVREASEREAKAAALALEAQARILQEMATAKQKLEEAEARKHEALRAQVEREQRERALLECELETRARVVREAATSRALLDAEMEQRRMQELARKPVRTALFVSAAVLIIAGCVVLALYRTANDAGAAARIAHQLVMKHEAERAAALRKIEELERENHARVRELQSKQSEFNSLQTKIPSNANAPTPKRVPGKTPDDVQTRARRGPAAIDLTQKDNVL